MEEQTNQIAVLTEDQVKLDKQKKSLNRRFGFLVVLACLLGAILIAEIIFLII